MPMRQDKFAPGNVYHVYNRGVNKSNVFIDDRDRERFVNLMLYCLPPDQHVAYSLAMRDKNPTEQRRLVVRKKPRSGAGLVDILSYCLMDNHIHLLLLENREDGIKKFMLRLQTGYAKYFNMRQQRQGHLFTGRFKSVYVETDEQLTHVSRYIHLNPLKAGIVRNADDYPWSSINEYCEPHKLDSICNTALIGQLLPSAQYSDFVTDFADYMRHLDEISDLTHE